MERVTGLSWHRTRAARRVSKYSRYDDVFFIDPDIGWCVGSDGRARKTLNGGATWTTVFQLPRRHRRLYLRLGSSGRAASSVQSPCVQSRMRTVPAPRSG